MQISWTHPTAGTINFNDPEHGITLMTAGIQGFGEPPRHETSHGIGNGDGQHVSGVRYGARTICLPVRLRQTPNESIRDLIDRFERTLRGGYRYPQFSEHSGLFDTDPIGGPGVKTANSERYLYCYVESVTPRDPDDFDPLELGFGHFDVKFEAPDPWWHGATGDQIVDVDIAPSDGGVPFYSTATDHVFDISSSNATGGFDLPNVGDLPVWLTWSVSGPLTSLRVWQDERLAVEIVKDLGFVKPGYSTLFGQTDPASAQLSGPSNPSGHGPLVDLSDFTAYDWRPVYPSFEGHIQTLTVDVRGGGRFHASYTPRYRRAY